MDPVDWGSLAIQAGGAITVCGMFLGYLVKRDKDTKTERREEREQFLKHIQDKDDSHKESISQLMGYLKDRDAQSKEIALSGHDKLEKVNHGLNELYGSIKELIIKVQ
jgi:DNA integrity scanning protein DisA with diadenylate cyclase activity